MDRWNWICAAPRSGATPWVSRSRRVATAPARTTPSDRAPSAPPSCQGSSRTGRVRRPGAWADAQRTRAACSARSRPRERGSAPSRASSARGSSPIRPRRSAGSSPRPRARAATRAAVGSAALPVRIIRGMAPRSTPAQRRLQVRQVGDRGAPHAHRARRRPVRIQPPPAGRVQAQMHRRLSPLQIVAQRRVELRDRGQGQFLGHQPGPCPVTGSRGAPLVGGLSGQGRQPGQVRGVGRGGQRHQVDALEGAGDQGLGKGHALEQALGLGAPGGRLRQGELGQQPSGGCWAWGRSCRSASGWPAVPADLGDGARSSLVAGV